MVAVRKILDNLVPDVEQVIEVPKILPHTVPQRSSLQAPQTAEQLVAVPGFEFVIVRRAPKEHSALESLALGGTTLAMRVHDTGWESPPAQGGI